MFLLQSLPQEKENIFPKMVKQRDTEHPLSLGLDAVFQPQVTGAGTERLASFPTGWGKLL